MSVPRVTSALFVAAYVRRVMVAGSFAAVMKKGAEEAGPVLIRVDRPDGTGQLFIPAPQSAYDDRPLDRLFVPRFHEGFAAKDALDAAVERERRFDPDLWLVAVEDREGRDFLGTSRLDGV